MLVAEYTKMPKGQSPILDFNVIENGQRSHISSIAVRDKRSARTEAARRGAKCWNF